MSSKKIKAYKLAKKISKREKSLWIHLCKIVYILSGILFLGKMIYNFSVGESNRKAETVLLILFFVSLHISIILKHRLSILKEAYKKITEEYSPPKKKISENDR